VKKECNTLIKFWKTIKSGAFIVPYLMQLHRLEKPFL
jgi:hypothetical protein